MKMKQLEDSISLYIIFFPESFISQNHTRYNNILTFKLMIVLAVKVHRKTSDLCCTGTYISAEGKKRCLWICIFRSTNT